MFKSKELVRVSIDLNQLIHEVLALVEGAFKGTGLSCALNWMECLVL